MSHAKRTSIAIAIAIVMGATIAAMLAPPSIAQTQISFIDTEGKFDKFIDLGKPDLSPGDHEVEIHTVTDPVDGSDVGTTYSRLEFLRIRKDGDVEFLLDETIRLAGGDVQLSGVARFGQFFEPGGVTLPVTGGTGDYVGATGTVNATATETEGAFLVTIDLVAP
jgi:allene oxide cyclase-like protein